MREDLSILFDQFIDSITLGEPQISRMNSAAQTVSNFVISKYELTATDVFLQGSYANGTAIEPVEGGEYDIDIVGVCVDQDLTCNQALNDLEAKFKSDGRFASRVVRKKPCVRLEYAGDSVGSFHVDVVPVRKSTTADQAPFESPRRDGEWRGTAPREYRDWCHDQGEEFRRTVMMLKRWRDEQQPVKHAIKSIVLQVLIYENFVSDPNDVVRLSGIFDSMLTKLTGLKKAPVILNPVLPNENLAQSWSDESFKSFVVELREATKLVKAAGEAADEIEAVDSLRELFGEDFPSYDSQSLGLEVLDYSHAETPEERGWTVQLDTNYRVSVVPNVQRARGGLRSHMLSENEVLFAGRKIHFRANAIAPRHVEMWWQVANTGQHATNDNGLRGKIFKGKDLEGHLIDEYENWEITKYHGSHLLRAMLVREGVVVAHSKWHKVNVWAARGFAGFRRR
jgi:hypothetical protein